jgi:GT2 family glycosyltransferase
LRRTLPEAGTAPYDRRSVTASVKTPEISVVIATSGRESRLRFALEALAAQTLGGDRFEVVVVRANPVSQPLAEAPEGLAVRFLTHTEASRPGQRNAGWRAAQGRLVAFTDDDCRPAPGWLEALATHDRAAVVQGRTEPDPDEAHLLFGLARSLRITGPTPWFETANIAYPRSLLERLGGFDEAFVASGEDTDLGLRALGVDANLRYESRALAWHAVVARPVWRAAADGWRRWHSTPLVFKRHPGHRRHLVAGVFYNRRHAALTGLIAGAAVARRRPGIAALAAAPYVLEGLDSGNLGPWGLVRQAIHLPARLVVDGAQVLGILRGAVRHRSVVI